MSTAAREIIERIKSLSTEEQQTVCQDIARIAEGRREWETQSEKQHEMQARHSGGGLLDERTKERACG